ncbi:MAG TPA: transglutaminase domain-containing protein [Clostridiaceae bacterium]|nr:transglutaminase domain-containing protein [Clostridiaceae bacterium]
MSVKKLLNHIVDILLASVAGFSFVYALTSSMNFSYPLTGIFVLVLAVIVFYSLVFINKLSFLITCITVGVLSFCTIIYLVLTDRIREAINYIYLPLNWFIGYISGNEGMNPDYEKFIVFLICIVISTAIYITLIRRFNFYILFIATASMYSIQHIMNYVTTLKPFYISLIIFLIYYLKYIHLKRFPDGQHDKLNSAVFTVYSIPLSMAITIIAFSIPASSKPIEWKWMDAKISSAYNAIYNSIKENFSNSNSKFFSLKETGFGRSIRNLGGKVVMDDTVVLKVKSPVRVYLKGFCGDIYTGSGWTKSSDNTSPLNEDIDSFSFDLYEYITGIWLFEFNRDTLEQLFEEQIIEIKYENIRTRTLFVPIKAFEIEAADIEQLGISTDSEGILSCESVLKKDFTYTVKMYNPRTYNEEFTNLLRKSRKGLYEELINTLTRSAIFRRALYRVILENIIQLSEYSKEIYSRYLQLPENLPERVKELALSITSQYNNNYDKAKAVEQYLAKNYPYTLNPEPVMKDNDFVDSFLFDIKEGYCTYYATAMAVLLRCAGIPARYVEGYMLPPKAEPDGTYLVTNNQAHAWTEVYFEGFGWIPFEPTSPFVSSFYAEEEFIPEITESFINDPYYNDYLQNLYDYGNTSIDLPDSSKDTTVESPVKPAFPLTRAFLLIPVLLICIIIFNFSKHKFKILKISRMSPKKSILSIYKYYLKILRVQKHGIKPGETPLSYSERIDCLFYFRPNTFEHITNIFIKARYSAAETSNQEKKEALDFYKPLMLETKENLGAIRFWVYKYVLGII